MYLEITSDESLMQNGSSAKLFLSLRCADLD